MPYADRRPPTPPSARPRKPISRRSIPKAASTAEKIDFISYDDGYNPAKTVEQARKLVESDEVLLIFNSLGTANNTAIQKYMNTKKVPQLFVFHRRRQMERPEELSMDHGWQPNYQVEARIYAAYILKPIPARPSASCIRTTISEKDYVIGLRDGLGDQANKLIVVEASTRPRHRRWIRRWFRSSRPIRISSSISRRRNSPPRRSRNSAS